MDIFKKWWFYVILGVIILLLPFAIKTALEMPPDTSPAPPPQDTAAPDTTAPETNPPETNPPETGNKDTTAPDTAEPDTTGMDTVTPDTAPETEPAAVTYVLNTDTRKFHIPTCSSVKDIKDKNRQDSTLTREEIVALGYSPCGRCKP